MARVPRGLGHLQLWYLEAACQCQALAPSPERAVAAISLYRVMRIFHPEHLTIDCSPDVGPGVKLQDMKQFPINPDCAPAPAASHSPPRDSVIAKTTNFHICKAGPEQVNRMAAHSESGLATAQTQASTSLSGNIIKGSYDFYEGVI